MEIMLRRARCEDREKTFEVESKTMPNYRYLPNVFDMFVSDEIGEFSVAELDGEIIARAPKLGVIKNMTCVCESKIKIESEDCPECDNSLTIFCVVPIECESDIPISHESKNTLKRFCPKCEHVWPIQ